MKRLNLLIKYSLLFTSVYLISFIFFSKIIDSSNEALITFSIFALAIYTVTVLFFYKEIISTLKKIFAITDKLKFREEDTEILNRFDEKVDELKILLENIDRFKSGFSNNREFFILINDIHLIAERILHEIETAKIFKINRNEFMGNVAHELRTPVFAIQLSLETLLDGAISDDKVNTDFLNRALNQTKRLKELVDDLISISKFEVAIKMSKRYFAISNAIEKTTEELMTLAEKKKINLIFDKSGANGVRVFGDEQKLQQVFTNLIDNAIKYTPEHGKVMVSLDVKDKEVIIKIEDNGIGIPSKDIKRIFERFYRVDKTRSRDIGGSGLGLSIVKHILEAHSSQIRVKSELNKGTIFEFSLNR